VAGARTFSNAVVREVKAMVRTITAVSDRLLGLVVPRVTAHADPCGREYYVFCHCAGLYYSRFCCSNGGCGSCMARGYCEN
jgi:hypothetical protein